MSIQPDSWIKKMCKEHNMIEPFLDHQVAEGKISYGLSSCLLYTSPSPRDGLLSRMPSSA